jgi:hypothetical protein
LVVDDGGPFSLPLSWVETLRERVVRMLAAAAAAAAARVGMVAVLCTIKVRIISQPLFDDSRDRRGKEKRPVIDPSSRRLGAVAQRQLPNPKKQFLKLSRSIFYSHATPFTSHLQAKLNLSLYV